MNNYKEIKSHAKELSDLAGLVSPSASQVKEELSHLSTFTQGCSHFATIISCLFRKAWYGITHTTSWMTDEKIYRAINEEILNIEVLIKQSSQNSSELPSPEFINTVKRSAEKAQRALNLLETQQKKEDVLIRLMTIINSRLFNETQASDQIHFTHQSSEVAEKLEAPVRHPEPTVGLKDLIEDEQPLESGGDKFLGINPDQIIMTDQPVAELETLEAPMEQPESLVGLKNLFGSKVSKEDKNSLNIKVDQILNTVLPTEFEKSEALENHKIDDLKDLTEDKKSSDSKEDEPLDAQSDQMQSSIENTKAPELDILEIEHGIDPLALRYLFEYEGKKAKEQKIAAPLNEQMLAHVLGGFMISNLKDFEGSTHPETLSYILDFIEDYLSNPPEFQYKIPIDRILKLKSELEQAKIIATKIANLQTQTHLLKEFEARNPTDASLAEKKKSWENNKREFVLEIMHDLKNIKVGRNYYLSAGWSGKPGKPGHALLYRFQKNENGKFNLTLINTGSGIGTHDYIFEGTKRKFNPVRHFENLDLVDNEIDEKFLTAFLEKKLLPFTKNAPDFNWMDVYGVDVERLKSKEVSLPLERQDAITGQRSGVCAYKSALIASRLSLGVQNYKVFKHILELKTLEKGLKKLTLGDYFGKNEHQVMHIVKRASKRMLIATIKLRKEKLISKQDARLVYEKCKNALKVLNEYKTLVLFKPFRPNMHYVYKENQLAKKIEGLRKQLSCFPTFLKETWSEEITRIPDPPDPSDNSSPEKFIQQLEKYLKAISHIKNSTNQYIKLSLIQKIGYFEYETIWNTIAITPELRKKAIKTLRFLLSISLSSFSVKEFLDFMGIYAVIAILAHHEWSENSYLRNFGANGNLFDDIKSYLILMDRFQPFHNKYLDFLNKINEGKDLLFEFYLGKIDLKKEENFYIWNDLKFCVAFLKNYPEIKDLMWEDENDSTEKSLRHKAYTIFSKPLTWKKSWDDSKESWFALNNNPSFIAYSLLRHLNQLEVQSQYTYNAFLGEVTVTSRRYIPLLNLPKAQIYQGNSKNDPFRFQNENQNSLITYYNNQAEPNLITDRELATVRANRINQLDHLLDLFEANSKWIQKPENQLYFRSCLLEDNILIHHLLSEPEIGQRLLAFINTAFNNIKVPHKLTIIELNTLVFLNQLTFKIIAYINEQLKSSMVLSTPPSQSAWNRLTHIFSYFHPDNSRFTRDENQFMTNLKVDLKNILAHQREFLEGEKQEGEYWQRAYLEYGLLLTHPLMDEEALKQANPVEIQELLIASARAFKNGRKAQDNKKTWKKALEYYDIQLERDVLTRLTGLSKLFKEGLKNQIVPLCQSIMKLYHYPYTKKWTGEFPIYRTHDHHKNTYEINLIMGSVSVNGRIGKTPSSEDKKNHLYEQLFGKDDSNIEWNPYGSVGFQTTYKNKHIKLLIQDKDIQLILEENGIPYILLKNSSITDIPLPFPFKKQTQIWMAPPTYYPAYLIFDQEMNQKIAFSPDGIRLVNDNKNLNFTEIYFHPQLEHIASFKRENALVWGEENQIKEISYRGIVDEQGRELKFIADKNQILRWETNSDYHISVDQSLHCLRGNTEYILLTSPKKDRKILILPRTTSEGKETYSAIPFDKDGELAPSNCLHFLHAAEIFFMEGDYERASHYLFQAKEARAYTEDEKKIIYQILTTENGDPWASVVRIYAATQLIDNVRMTPPSQLKNALDRTIYETLIKDYFNFVTNRNVPAKYQPRQILGLDREIRLLRVLKSRPDFPTELKLYYLEITQKDYPSQALGTFKGTQAEVAEQEQMDTSTLTEVLSTEQENVPDFLTRPEEFKKVFRHYYQRIRTCGNHERAEIKDRLSFMRYDQNKVNAWLVNFLLSAIDVVDNPDIFKGIILPKLSQYTKGQSEYTLWNEVYNKTLPEINKFLRQVKAAKLERKLTSTNIESTFDVKIPKTPPQLLRKDLRAFTSINPSFYSNSNYANYAHEITIPSTATELYSSKELEILNQRLKLPNYVYSQLVNLNKLVNTEEIQTPKYNINDDVKPADLKTLFDNEISKLNPQIQQRKDRIEQLANKMSGDPEKDLELDLLRASEKQETWTLEKCLVIFLHDRWDLLNTKDPPLTVQEIDQLHQMIVEYLVLSIQKEKAQRGLQLLEDIESVKNDKSTADKLKIDLASLLMVKWTYNPNQNPALLLFEYASGWTISPAQTAMLNELFTKDSEGNTRNLILQLIMGGGKSRVISPIQAQMKADGENLSLLVVPDSLFETTCNDSSRNLFSQNVKSLQFSREDNNVEYLESIQDMCEEAITYREYIITRPKDLLCLELVHWECRLKLSELTDRSSRWELETKAELLKEILKLLNEKGFATFDEGDTIFYCKYHVNFTLGDASSPTKDVIELTKNLYQILSTHPSLRNIVRLHQNRQSLLTDQEWEKVEQTLLKEMVHRIKEDSQIPLDIEALHQYCQGKATDETRETYTKLLALYNNKTSTPPILEGIRKLGLLKLEIENLLKETLKKNVNTHYGLSKEKPGVGYAIPYRANNTPNENSQFADLFETMNKTYQVFLSEWTVPEQTTQLIHYLRNKVEHFLKNGFEDEAQTYLDNFKKATSFDLFPKIPENEFAEKVTKSLNESIKQNEQNLATIDLILDFLENVVLSQQLPIYTSQLSSNTQDLDGIVASSQGYSGTVSSKNTFPLRISTIENNETDREISRALINDSCPIHEVDEEDPEKLLKTLFSDRKDIHSFRSFIDIGSLFKGMSNLEVAKKMLSYFEVNKQEVQAIIFWDDLKNTPVLLYRELGVLQLTPLGETSRNAVKGHLKKLNLKFNQVFTYYDERHIKGSDLYHKPGARAFATVNSQTKKDELFQGVMRMRFTAKREHHIELVVHKEEKKKMALTLSEKEFYNLNIRDVIIHTELVQATQGMFETLEATRQMMLRKVIQVFRQKVLYSVKPTQSQSWFEFIKLFVKQSQPIDPFLEYGGIYSETDIDKHLHAYADSLISKIKECKSFNSTKEFLQIVKDLEDQLKTITNTQLSKGCLPEKATQHSTTNVEVQRQTETSKKVETSKHVEVSRETEKHSKQLSLKPYTEKKWTVSDLFSDKINFYPSSEGMPKFSLLNSKLSDKELDGLLANNILVTDNFLYSADEETVDLFNLQQKGIVDILVIEENGDVKVAILSIDDAAFVKSKIAEQKKKNTQSPHRNLWLLNPEGKIVQQGTVTWKQFSKKPLKEKADHLLFQTLLLSGNLRRVSKNKKKLADWIEKEPTHGKEVLKKKLRILIEKATHRLPLESNRFSNYPDLEKILT